MSTIPSHVAVIGAGAFGRNHLRVYRELEAAGAAVRLAAIVDANPRTCEALREQWKVPVFASIEECLRARQSGDIQLDAASICVPTSAHFEAAGQALAHGLDVLIEKPLAATLEQADGLVRQATEAERILQVGHLERFNPAITAVAPLLNGPMFFEAHRLSIFTPRALDVDVVLDLMIHDLDIVLSFARSPVHEVRAVGLPILSSRVDIANVRLEFESGAVANFTASRVSTEQVRKLRFFQPHEYVSIDYARQDLLMIHVAKEAAAKQQAAAMSSANAIAGMLSQASQGSLPEGPGLSFDKPSLQKGEPLRLELEAFLRAIRDRSQPLVSAQEGRDALALALEINREILAHSQRAGLDRYRA